MSIHHYTDKEISQVKYSWLQALYILFGFACVGILSETFNNYSGLQTLRTEAIAYIGLFLSYGLTYYYGYKKPWKSFLLVNTVLGFVVLLCNIGIKIYNISSMFMQGSRLTTLILITLSSLFFFVVKIYYYYMSYKLYSVYDAVDSQK